MGWNTRFCCPYCRKNAVGHSPDWNRCPSCRRMVEVGPRNRPIVDFRPSFLDRLWGYRIKMVDGYEPRHGDLIRLPVKPAAVMGEVVNEPPVRCYEDMMIFGDVFECVVNGYPINVRLLQWL